MSGSHNPRPGEEFVVEEISRTADKAVFDISGTMGTKNIEGKLTLTLVDGEFDGWDWVGTDLTEDEESTILDLFADEY